MAVPNHAEGPIIVYVNAAGTSARAVFNGSLGEITTATGADRGATITNIVAALETTVPWGDLLGLPLIFVNEPPRTPQPI